MSSVVRLERVARQRAPVLARLMQLYRHDGSEFNGDAIDESGAFDLGAYFDAYWVEPERCPYFIRVEQRLAGFALVRQLEPGTWSVVARRGRLGRAEVMSFAPVDV